MQKAETINKLFLTEDTNKKFFLDGLQELNKFLFVDTNENLLIKVLENNLDEISSMGFNSLDISLTNMLGDKGKFALLNALLAYSNDFKNFFEPFKSDFQGDFEKLRTKVLNICAVYSYKTKKSFYEWRGSVRKNWNRIVTEPIIIEKTSIELESTISLNSGNTFEFTSSIPSTIILVDHFLRQINSVIQIIGEEPSQLLFVDESLLKRIIETTKIITEQKSKLNDKLKELTSIADKEVSNTVESSKAVDENGSDKKNV